MDFNHIHASPTPADPSHSYPTSSIMSVCLCTYMYVYAFSSCSTVHTWRSHVSLHLPRGLILSLLLPLGTLACERPGLLLSTLGLQVCVLPLHGFWGAGFRFSSCLCSRLFSPASLPGHLTCGYTNRRKCLPTDNKCPLGCLLRTLNCVPGQQPLLSLG